MPKRFWNVDPCCMSNGIKERKCEYMNKMWGYKGVEEEVDYRISSASKECTLYLKLKLSIMVSQLKYVLYIYFYRY